MKTACLTAPRTLKIEDRPALSAAPGETVIDVEWAGVCGTDLALFSGDYPVPLPLVCGHEFVGRVKTSGRGVPPRWRGRRITAEINNTCRAYARPDPCRACAANLCSHCLNRSVTGIIQHDGAFAEQVVVPAGVLHELPETLDPLTAVLTEPLAAALQTFEMTPVTGDEKVAVLGAGRLGVLIVFAAAQRGLETAAVSRSEAKRQRAQEYGAARGYTPEEAAAGIQEWTEGLGADLVIEATGSPDGLTLAQTLVRPRGTVSVKTTCGLPETGLDITKLVVDEVRLQGSRCGPFAPALELLNANQDTLKKLITSVRPLDDAQQAVESAYEESKVVLQVGETN